MINPQKKLWRWGPIDGRLIYVSYFMIAIQGPLPRLYKYLWPESLFYFIKNKMTFISQEKEIRDNGEEYFKNWILNDKNFKKVKTDYQKALKGLEVIQANLSKKYLSLLSNKDLFKIYYQWQKLYINFWGIGLIPELANLGGEEILKQRLSQKTKSQKEFVLALEKLSAPQGLSFYQQEELDLLRLKEYQKEKKFDELIEKHSQKYYWIRNSYFEQKQLKADYFKEILSGIKRAKFKINEIKNFPQKALIGANLIIKKHQLDKKTIKIAKRLSYSIWWQDSRKKEIFIANQYIDLFLKEISKRKKINFSNLRFYWPTEIIKLLRDNKKVSFKEIAKRKKFILIHYYKNTLTYKSGKKQKDLIKPFLTKNIDINLETITGSVVSTGCGKVKGKVRILLTPRNVNKMKKGEILVARMTSPEFIVAMKKAKAIITDEGGITSHAAIVSRELGIPCLVGTKIATRVLKDGDLVEVNANHNLVKILKK